MVLATPGHAVVAVAPQSQGGAEQGYRGPQGGAGTAARMHFLDPGRKPSIGRRLLHGRRTRLWSALPPNLRFTTTCRMQVALVRPDADSAWPCPSPPEQPVAPW